MFKKLLRVKKAIPLSTQLDDLKRSGIGINPDIDLNELFNLFKKKEFEEKPYEYLLIALGCEVQNLEDLGIPMSNDIWYLDTECIEDTGDYVRVIERLVSLSKGTLELSNVKDYIDMEKEEVWVSFSIGDKEHKWDLEFIDDWLDINLFTLFNELLSKQGSDKRFAVSILDQTILVGFFDSEQIKEINELSSYKFDVE